MTILPIRPDAPPERAPQATAELEAIMGTSPRWGPFTKFLIALIFVVLLGALLLRFQQMIVPLVLAVVLTYLLRPVASAVATRTVMSWQASVAVVYLVLLVVLLGLLTLSGIALIQQIQGLYSTVVDLSADLPGNVQRVISAPFFIGPFYFDLSRPFFIGPFRFDLTTTDLTPLYQQVLGALQPVLSRTGEVVSRLAAGTAEAVGWMLFILIVSYYLLSDSRRMSVSIEALVPPNYAYDVRRMLGELVPIWNAFLRGQITLAIVMGIVIGLTMTVLGVRYSIVLGLMGGVLEFVPIIGPLIVGVTAVVIALFQPTNWLGINPVAFAIVVLVASILLQQVENNFLVPRIIGGNLNLHPVAILVGAVIAANLAGIIGLLLSAPIVATLRLVGRYVYRKMFDLDPWPDPPAAVRMAAERTWIRWVRRRASDWWNRRR
jgi:predicted PurR-regulated permease PerM